MTTANRAAASATMNTGEDLNRDRFRCPLPAALHHNSRLAVDDTSMKYRFVWLLMKSDSYDIVAAIELSRATLQQMHQNLWWAVGYNANCVPARCWRLVPICTESGCRSAVHVRQYPLGGNLCARAEAYQAGGHPPSVRDCVPLVLTPGMAAS